MISIRKRHFNQIPLLEVFDSANEGQIVPAIIYYHGWRSNKELVLTNVRKLAEAGFRVFVPDALNHGERWAEVAPMPSFTFWQTINANINEFHQIVAHATSLQLIDPDRIGVAGVSMGGMTTAALLAANPQIQAGACLMGTPELVNYRKLVFRHAKANGIEVANALALSLSWIENFDLSLQPELIANRPLYIWHDVLDKRIPFADVQDFYDHTKDSPANQNMTFVKTDQFGHLLTADIMEQTVQFFRENLN